MNEIFFFVKKLTFKKVVNAISVYVSYFLSVLFKIPLRSGYPPGISTEPVAKCNLHCPECPAGTGKLNRYDGNIDFELFKKVIDEFAPYLTSLMLYFQGEPFLNKDIFRLTEYASLNKNIYTVCSTNGHFLSEEFAEKIILSGLDKIIISLDGTNQETYEKYRKGGSFDTVVKGIENLVKMRKKMKSERPFIVIQFLVFKFNEHEINAIKQLRKKSGADKLELKSAQIYDFKNREDLIPGIKKYARYKKNKSGDYEIKSKLKNRCKRLWETCVITNNGDVLPCCFDKNADYVFGNMKTVTFKEINNNEKSVSFRKKLLKNRSEIDICRNCTEGLKK